MLRAASHRRVTPKRTARRAPPLGQRLPFCVRIRPGLSGHVLRGGVRMPSADGREDGTLAKSNRGCLTPATLVLPEGQAHFASIWRIIHSFRAWHRCRPDQGSYFGRSTTATSWASRQRMPTTMRAVPGADAAGSHHEPLALARRRVGRLRYRDGVASAPRSGVERRPDCVECTYRGGPRRRGPRALLPLRRIPRAERQSSGRSGPLGVMELRLLEAKRPPETKAVVGRPLQRGSARVVRNHQSCGRRATVS